MAKRETACLIVDWSARRTPAPARASKDSIWLCWRSAGRVLTEYCRTRIEAEAMIREMLLRASGNVVAGFDFSFGYPAWAMEALGGWREIWPWLESQPVEEDRFLVAGRMNEALGGAYFWGAPPGVSAVASTKPAHGMPEFRECEMSLKPRPKSSFQLYGNGAVGSQSLVGIPALERLRQCFGEELAVWPFEEIKGARIVLAEVWPSLLGRPPEGVIADRWQVESLSEQLQRQGAWWDEPLPPAAQVEGWILKARPSR